MTYEDSNETYEDFIRREEHEREMVRKEHRAKDAFKGCLFVIVLIVALTILLMLL
jgi:hypothetical protein